MSDRAKQAEGNRVHFWCPGCDDVHGIRHGGEGWTWNDSLELPTFSPSVLVRFNMRGVDFICHSFVTEGRIQFLMDSTHKLAGQTVDLPPWPYGK
jgi:hypothetical protein